MASFFVHSFVFLAAPTTYISANLELGDVLGALQRLRLSHSVMEGERAGDQRHQEHRSALQVPCNVPATRAVAAMALTQKCTRLSRQ